MSELTPIPRARTRSTNGRRLSLPLLLLALLTAACDATPEGIAALPPGDRAALLARTLETLRTVCPRASGAQLEQHCREQAALARSFPECDASCEALAHRFGPRPTR